MKRKRKIIIAALCLLALVSAAVICGETISAQVALHHISNGTVTTSSPIEVGTVKEEASGVGTKIRDDGNIIYKNVFFVDGQKNYLLCTFEDPAKALENEKRIDARFLLLVQKKWGMAEFSDSNWKDYRQHLVQYTMGALPDDLGAEKLYSQYTHLTGFFDIYEDEQKNRHALDYISSANAALKAKKISRISLDPIMEDIPYGSPILGTYQRKMREERSSSR